MSQDKLYFSTVKLLSQYLSDLEPLYNQTACLGLRERKLIGILAALETFPEIASDKELIDILHLIRDFFKKLGVANWQRYELTDLGLAVGSKHEESSERVLDESDIYQPPNKE